MKYSIDSLTKNAYPVNFPVRIGATKHFQFRVVFDENCMYEQQTLQGQNYDGFNKVAGISFNLSKFNYNSAMCGWRCNAAKKCLELIPYANILGANFYDFGDILTCNPNDVVICSIDIINAGVNYTIEVNGKAITRHFPMPTYNFIPLSHIIYFWFGGQLSAPHDVSAAVDMYVV